MKDKGLDSLKGFLEKDYRLVLEQVPVLNKRVDLLCFEQKNIIAIEIKSKRSEIPIAIGQCSFYKNGVHKTYIALPQEEIRKITHEKTVLKDMGIGLISIKDKSYTVVLESKRSLPKKEVVNAVMESMKSMKKISNVVEGYKALANSFRLQVYLAVCEKERVGLKDIVNEWGESYPLTIKHINVLTKANLIESERIGKETYFKLKSYPVELKEDIVKRRILELIINQPGITLRELITSLNLSYQTIAKYLCIFDGMGRIRVKMKGNTKHFYLRKSAQEVKLR